jgi:hypothetical protein
MQRKRLTITDPETRITFLIDSGADISVLPSAFATTKNQSTVRFLLAANGSRIATFGEKIISVSLGLRRNFVWRFVIAEVDGAIIGADFLYHFNILIDLKGQRLIDNDTLECIECTTCTFNYPELKMITIDHPYIDLVNKYPEITNIENKTATTSTTMHHILTKGPPIHAKARQLPPDKLKSAKKEFETMVRLGICRASKSPWSSPLHLVLKPKRFMETLRRLPCS